MVAVAVSRSFLQLSSLEPVSFWSPCFGWPEVCICIDIHLYILYMYIYIYRERDMCIYIHTYMHIYIYRERERVHIVSGRSLSALGLFC